MADFKTPVKSPEDADEFFHTVSRKGISEDEVSQTYKVWARQYNQDATHVQWNAPKLGAEQVIRWVKDKSARILDVAAGTGLCGELLHKAGFTHLDALDASQEMLDEAGKLKVFKELIQAFMGPNRLPIQDDTYDVLVCVGGFVPGHLKEDCYEEMIRITKPGGYIITVMCERYFIVNEDYAGKLESRMNELEAAGAWTRLQRAVVPAYWNQYNGVAHVLRPEPGKDKVLA